MSNIKHTINTPNSNLIGATLVLKGASSTDTSSSSLKANSDRYIKRIGRSANIFASIRNRMQVFDVDNHNWLCIGSAKLRN